MGKYSDSLGLGSTQAATQFKSQRDEDEHVGRLAWNVVCAKLGFEPPDIQASGKTKSEMHEARKAARQTLNKIRMSIGLREPSDDETHAILWAGVKIGRLESLMEDGDGAFGGVASDAAAWRGADGHAMRAMTTPEDYRAHYRAVGREFESDAADMQLGDFFRGVANMPTTAAVKNALTVGTDTAGGFSVPNILMPQILNALVPNSSLLQAGMPIVPLDSGGKNFTTAVMNAIPTAAWRSENGTVAESDPTFRGVVATPRSLSFFFKISRELLADSPNINGALLTAIGQAMAKELDRAGLRGTGVAPIPTGVLSTAGIQSVTNGANGTVLASYANIFTGMQSILEADAPMPTAAIMAPRTLARLGGLIDSTGQPLALPDMLKPMKMLGTSQIPKTLTVGSSTDCSEIYLGDFTKMAMMLRETLSVQLLSELYAGTGQLAFMCHCRADFAVMYPAAFAVVTGVR